MIVFDLSCDQGHRFEGWFGSSADYEGQHAGGLLACPQCGSERVEKAPMAPAVPLKGNRRPDAAPGPQHGTPQAPQGMANVPMPAEVQRALARLAEAQAKALANSTWVGKHFAEDARAMHYGEREPALIHGEASPAEARKLLEEGIEVAPLPFPVAPPDELN